MGHIDVAYLSAISGTNRNKPGQSTGKNVGVQLRRPFGLSRSSWASLCCRLYRCWSTNKDSISNFWNKSKLVAHSAPHWRKWEHQLHIWGRLGPNGNRFKIQKANGLSGLIPSLKDTKPVLKLLFISDILLVPMIDMTDVRHIFFLGLPLRQIGFVSFRHQFFLSSMSLKIFNLSLFLTRLALALLIFLHFLQVS